MARRILLATGNPHKFREAEEILAGSGVEPVPPDAVGGLPEVVEDGATFAANAVKKAVSACRHTGLWALADDSGLEARALAWAPGVRSARYAGGHGDDVANYTKLLADLADRDDRYLRFRCVIALARPDREPLTWEGVFPGEALRAPRGRGGFGYDPVVLVPELGRSVAELSPAEKHARSHRGQALRAFRDWLRSEAEC